MSGEGGCTAHCYGMEDCILFMYIHACVCMYICVCMYVCVCGGGEHIIFTWDISAGSGSLVIKWHHLGIGALFIACSTDLSQAFPFFFFVLELFSQAGFFLYNSGRN